MDLVKQRGAALGDPNVLLMVNAIRTLVLNSGPSQLPSTASITTPSQIAKNMITNASFRAKKMGDDIPKVSFQLLSHEGKIIMVKQGDITVPAQGLDEGTLFVEIDGGLLTGDKDKVKIGIYSEGELIETTKTAFLGPRSYN